MDRFFRETLTPRWNIRNWTNADLFLTLHWKKTKFDKTCYTDFKDNCYQVHKGYAVQSKVTNNFTPKGTIDFLNHELNAYIEILPNS